MKFKWKVASAPYKRSVLFGEVLDPILIENKDKGKIYPSLTGDRIADILHTAKAALLG